MVEDYMYCCFNSAMPHERGEDFILACWADVWETLYRHYFLLNGRLSNVLVILVQYWAGKGLFDVLNTVMGCLFLWTLCKLAVRRFCFSSLILVLISVFLLLPTVRMTCLWMDGAANYLWGAAFTCSLLASVCWYGESDRTNHSPGLLAWVILSGLLAGSMHEACGVPLSIALVLSVVCLWKRKRTISPILLIASVAVLFGTLLPVLSPGIWNRASHGMSSSFGEIAWETSASLVRYSSLVILLWGIAFAMKWRTTWNSVWSFYVLGNLAIAIPFGRLGSNGCPLFYMNFSMMLWLLVYDGAKLMEWKKYWFIPVLLLVIWLAGKEAGTLMRIHDMEQEVAKQAQTSPFVVIDVDGEYHSWYMNRALCVTYTSDLWSIMAEANGLPRHCVILRTLPQNNAYYKLFEGMPTDKAHVHRDGDRLVIRLPEKEVLATSNIPLFIPPEGKNEGLEPCTVRPYRLNPILMRIWRAMGKEWAVYSMDYHEGFVYVILQAPSSSYHEITLPLRNMETWRKRQVLVSLDES